MVNWVHCYFGLSAHCTRSIDCKGQRSRKEPCLSSPTKLALIAEVKCHGQKAFVMSFSSAEYQISRHLLQILNSLLATTWHRYYLDKKMSRMNYFHLMLLKPWCTNKIKEYYVIKMKKFVVLSLCGLAWINFIFSVMTFLFSGRRRRCCRCIICSYFRHKPYHQIPYLFQVPIII